SPAAVVHAGLPITADLVTLNLEVAQGTMIHRPRNVNEASFAIVDTQSFYFGPKLPELDLLLPLKNPLTPFKIREEEQMGEPLNLRTGEYTRAVSGDWDKGRLAIRVSDPGPFGLAALGLGGSIPAVDQVMM
ncbi:MAG TPA: hypothetical protein VFT32_13090, partial [Candidatus Eisenbacteria bacterium]|nr:hypothetical protein [Candidatus Eisenbacteria bacterium]